MATRSARTRRSRPTASRRLSLPRTACNRLSPLHRLRKPGENVALHLAAVGFVQHFVTGAGVVVRLDASQAERVVALHQPSSADQVLADRVELALNDEHRQGLWDARLEGRVAHACEANKDVARKLIREREATERIVDVLLHFG